MSRKAVFLWALVAAISGFALGHGLSVLDRGTPWQSALQPRAVPYEFEFRSLAKSSSGWRAEAVLDICGDLLFLEGKSSDPCAAIEEINGTLGCLGVDERVELACGVRNAVTQELEKE